MFKMRELILFLKCRTSEKPDEGLFTAKELESLEKKITDVEKWRDEKLDAQEQQPLSEMPKLTVSVIKSKALKY